MILSDGTIAERLEDGDISIDPFPDPDQIQPASLDVRLGSRSIHVGRRGTHAKKREVGEEIPVSPGDCFLLETHERIRLPSDLAAELSGRSTLGRKFVTLHVTAGWLDPGWDGHVTFEVTNLGPVTQKLKVGDPVGQLVFYPLDAPAVDPYDGQYTGDGPEPAGDL